MPSPEHWAEITNPNERLRTALDELYAWYAETEQMLHAGIRDIEHVPAGSREAFLGYFKTVHAALMAGRRERGRHRARVSGAIAHATNFHTWRSLVREQQLSADEAITPDHGNGAGGSPPDPRAFPGKPGAQPGAHAHEQIRRPHEQRRSAARVALLHRWHDERRLAQTAIHLQRAERRTRRPLVPRERASA